MARRKTRKAVSQAQARLFGAHIGTGCKLLKSLSCRKARQKLRGVKVKRLPLRIGKK